MQRLGALRRYTTRSSFEKFGVPLSVCQRLAAHGRVDQPTLAQSKLIPAMLAGHNIFLRDQAGSGKSMGIAIGLASSIAQSRQSHANQLASLYIAPNEALVHQIYHWITELADPAMVSMTPLTSPSTIPHTLIGTPGQLLALLPSLKTQHLKRIVLDEADQALRLPKRFASVRDRRMREQHPKPAQLLLEQLLKHERPQMIVTSATFNRPLRHWLTHAKGWVRDPVFLDMAPKANSVQHFCLLVSDNQIRNIGTTPSEEIVPADFPDTDDRMLENIATLCEVEQVHNGVLFVGTSVSILDVIQHLEELGVYARDLSEYKHNTNQDTKKQPSIWVANEFSARGVDIPHVSHVFIVGRPTSYAAYLHMAGRTGRLGRHGFSGGKVVALVRDYGQSEAAMSTMYRLLDINVEHYQHVQ